MGIGLAVRCAGSNRRQIIQMIEFWCIDNKIIAYADSKSYMTESIGQGDGDKPEITTTYWTVPDETDRTLFILRWCK